MEQCVSHTHEDSQAAVVGMIEQKRSGPWAVACMQSGHCHVRNKLQQLCVPVQRASRHLSYASHAAHEDSHCWCFRDDRKDKNGEVPGFGQLHPRSQGITTLGTIYSSSVFPKRAPKGEHLVLNFIGGATNRGIVQQSEEDLVKQV